MKRVNDFNTGDFELVRYKILVLMLKAWFGARGKLLNSSPVRRRSIIQLVPADEVTDKIALPIMRFRYYLHP
jgi:hypothetical protein